MISHPTGYAEWSPYVAESTLVTQGDETGVGTVTRSRWTSALRYNLVFTTCTVRAERPHVIELTSTGDLDGTGRWGLSADGDVTTVRYDWNVCTTKRWVDLLAPVARPAFDRNHAIIMRAGGEGPGGAAGGGTGAQPIVHRGVGPSAGADLSDGRAGYSGNPRCNRPAPSDIAVGGPSTLKHPHIRVHPAGEPRGRSTWRAYEHEFVGRSASAGRSSPGRPPGGEDGYKTDAPIEQLRALAAPGIEPVIGRVEGVHGITPLETLARDVLSATA